MKKTYEELSNFLNQSFDDYLENNKNKMNTVTFYHNNIQVQQFTFATEKEAVDCMVRHADAKGLEINDHYSEAYSEGNKPETLIIVNQI